MTQRINNDLADLTLSIHTMNGPDTIHPALVFDAEHGLVLIDAGVPGLTTAFQQALDEVGVQLPDIKTILISHHDYDHIGSLPEIVAATSAQVWAAPKEVPYIQDGVRAQKPPPLERVEAALQSLPEAQRPYFRAMWTHVQPPVKVARELQNDEVLPFAGGVRVIYTPGHTVGHTSFFLERSKVLIAADALMARDGQLTGPWDRATPDMVSANASVRRLAALEPSMILCYHGGLISEDAAGQLRRLAEIL